MKHLIYILFLILAACSDEPIELSKTQSVDYVQEWEVSDEVYGTRTYTINTDGKFRYLQESESKKAVQTDMKGIWRNINDSVIDFTWLSIMSVTIHKDWNDTSYYHTYGIFNEDKTTMRVELKNGNEAHPYGELFYKQNQN